MATKNANVMARIEPEIKNKAEAILSTLGLSSSGAINLLYRQIIMNNGLPFPVSIPNMPIALEDMSKEEFDSMMKQGLEDAKQGRGMKLEDAVNEIREEL